MMRALLYIVPIAMAIYALVDLVQYRDDNPLGMPKGLWALVIIIVPVIGPIGWIVISRMTRPPKPKRRRPEPPVAPDDNLEYLRELDRKRWREERERERRRRESEGEAPDDPAP